MVWLSLFFLLFAVVVVGIKWTPMTWLRAIDIVKKYHNCALFIFSPASPALVNARACVSLWITFAICFSSKTHKSHARRPSILSPLSSPLLSLSLSITSNKSGPKVSQPFGLGRMYISSTLNWSKTQIDCPNSIRWYIWCRRVRPKSIATNVHTATRCDAILVLKWHSMCETIARRCADKRIKWVSPQQLMLLA